MSSALEGIKSIDLEEWLTLATAPAPSKLKQGQTPDMSNVWTDEKPGSIITAPGFLKVGQIPSGNPVTFCINYFKTSAGTQTFVVSDNSSVWTTIDFQTFTSIITGLSSSFQLRGAVIRDKLWLTNGSDAVRTFDGTIVTILDGTGGHPAAPRGRFIAYHDERVWLYHTASARSAVYFSSLTDSSGTIIAPDDVNAWDLTDNFLQISEGDADYGTGMLLYRGYLHFFKQYSIWRLVGYDEYTYSRVKTRSSTGTRFNESIQILDSLVHLIGVDGIYVFDGEESVRISDIIDPATASQTAFGFNQLQQPNTNNQFFEVTKTADWNAGTVPTDLVVDDSIEFQACDDSQADFQAGATQTNLDLLTNPGAINLATTTGGVSFTNLALNQACALVFVDTSFVGVGDSLTDGSTNTYAGFNGKSTASRGKITVALPAAMTQNITTIILQNVSAGAGASAIIESNGTIITPSSVSSPGSLTGAQINFSAGEHDYTITYPAFTSTEIEIFVAFAPNTAWLAKEIQIKTAAYFTTGKFVSKTLDLGMAPSIAGQMAISNVSFPTGTGFSLFTQTSNDGISWDAEAPVSGLTSSGTPPSYFADITSTPRRYVRWIVYLTSDGNSTPSIDQAFLPAVFVSAISDTGGSIFSWGPFESDYSLNGQPIGFFYRTATTSGGIAVSSWKAIVPGGVISDPVANQFIQFKIEMLEGEINLTPIVRSVTINWVKGSAGQPQTLQNVASVYWRNRYWLSAAGPGASSNNVVLIRGKKTFQSPWMLKDWSILSFARYFDNLYGGSSVDGSIYQLDTGYAKDGVAMDSYFETGDFTFGGFTANLVELLVEVERLGPWNLNVGVSIDGGNTWDDYPVDLSLSTYDSSYCKRITGNGAGATVSYTTTRFRLRFRTNGIDAPFQVHRCIVFYTLSGVRGSIRGDYM